MGKMTDINIKARLCAATCCAAAIAFASPAAADPGIGQPTIMPASCFGSDMAFGAREFGGLANAAEAFGVTLQQGRNFYRAADCDRRGGITPFGFPSVS